MKLIDAEAGLAAKVERWLIAESHELSDPQRLSLHNELVKPEYSGLTDTECLERLRTATTGVRSIRRDADWPATKRWLKQFSDGLLFGTIVVSAQIKSKWLLTLPNLSYDDDYTYNPEATPVNGRPSTFDILSKSALADGIIKPEQLAEFVQSWYTQEDVFMPSPLDSLFNEDGSPLFTANCALELSDIMGCR